MIITTKFNIGDIVYFMGGIPIKVLSSTIVAINVKVDEKGIHHITYSVGKLGDVGPESLLFATKKQLLDSL